jgi:hypothetical protein
MLDLPDEWIERTVNSIRYQTFSFPDCTILRLWNETFLGG